MPVLPEFPRSGSFSGYVAADLHRRGIRGGELRIHLLQRRQIAHHPVVFEIRYLGVVQHIIPVVVLFKLLPEELYPLLNLFFVFKIHIKCKNIKNNPSKITKFVMN